MYTVLLIWNTSLCLVRPKFTDAKIKSFMIVKAGNAARFNITFVVNISLLFKKC